MIINGNELLDCNKLKQYIVLSPESRIFKNDKENLDDETKANFYDLIVFSALISLVRIRKLRSH